MRITLTAALAVTVAASAGPVPRAVRRRPGGPNPDPAVGPPPEAAAPQAASPPPRQVPPSGSSAELERDGQADPDRRAPTS